MVISVKLLCYFGGVFITWLLWLPLLLNTQFGLQLPVVPLQHYIGSVGPLLAAMLATHLYEGRQGVARFLTRIFRPAGNPAWYGFALGMPTLSFLFAVLIQWCVSGQYPDFSGIGITDQLPDYNVFVTWFFWLLTFGLGEESGWRGFALQELQKIWRPVPAALILGCVWAIWHILAFFYHEKYMAMGAPAVIGWLISIMYGSVVFSWIRNKTRGSIIIVALWHGTFDTLIASKAAVGMIPAIMSGLVIMFAIFVMRKTKGLLGYKPEEWA